MKGDKMLDFFNTKGQASFPAIFESRAIFELAGFQMSLPLLNKAPEGDGHPVIILPHPCGNNDFSTIPLNAFLKSKGYAVYEEGPEIKESPLSSLIDGVNDKFISRLNAIQKKHKSTVSLIGWSLGGIYAREVARQAPDCVRMVITLAAPFINLGDILNSAKLMNEFMLGEKLDKMDPRLWKRLEMPLPVPSSAIFSRTDGMVPWKSCREHADNLDEISENIEVEGSHFGLVNNPSVIWVIADRLSQPEDQWKPFDRSGVCRFLYRDPARKDYCDF
jgi:hypothetical protein